jgi:taurine--2-oxoglutarate transaminase
MRKQMEKVIYVTDDFSTEPTAYLADQLAKLSPGNSHKKIFFHKVVLQR